MKRLFLEARRARGWLALHVVLAWPFDPMFTGPLLSWAGTFAFWDADRGNWRIAQ